MSRLPIEEDHILEVLQQEAKGRMGPVRPLRPSWLRAGAVSLIWLVSLILVLTVFGLRRDYPEIGPAASWGVSALQTLAAWLMAWTGLRMSIPGDLPARSWQIGVLLGGCGLHVAGLMLALHWGPSSVEAGQEVRLALVCFFFVALLASLPLALSLRLASDGLLSDLPSAGILFGLSSGLAAESVWRMHCPYTSWEHIVAGHSSSILAVALAGLAWLRFRPGTFGLASGQRR